MGKVGWDFFTLLLGVEERISLMLLSNALPAHPEPLPGYHVPRSQSTVAIPECQKEERHTSSVWSDSGTPSYLPAVEGAQSVVMERHTRPKFHSSVSPH